MIADFQNNISNCNTMADYIKFVRSVGIPEDFMKDPYCNLIITDYLHNPIGTRAEFCAASELRNIDISREIHRLGLPLYFGYQIPLSKLRKMSVNDAQQFVEEYYK